MDKLLRLKIYVDGGINDTPFPNADDPIEIGAFRYDAKRMGGAPTITASVNYPSCLDDAWADNVYAEFNGEKYYLKQTPTSSYNNESAMYRHDLELVSERSILNDVYFFDAVVGNPQGEDKPVSDSTKVMFFGNIYEFVKRLNSSLEYTGLLKWEDGVDKDGNNIKIPNGYHVVVDNNENITTEEKLMSFEDQFFSNVLQEIYNVYEVPYYFEGKTIHIGWSNDKVVVPTFSYGVDDALLSITKNNANQKIINRITGVGSSDNIPFYYPNNSPKGEIAAVASRDAMGVSIINAEAFSNKIGIDGVLTYDTFSLSNPIMKFGGKAYASNQELVLKGLVTTATQSFALSFNALNAGVFKIDLYCDLIEVLATGISVIFAKESVSHRFTVSLLDDNGKETQIVKSSEDGKLNVPIEKAGNYTLKVDIEFASMRTPFEMDCTYALEYSFEESTSAWIYEGKEVALKDIGLKVEGNLQNGDTITQKLVKYVKTSQNLMPSIYRETDGAERFYNATNNTYEGISFYNPYVEGRPKEHIVNFEDIKPTIEGMEVNGLRIDMFSEFAYDFDDNDETVENEEGSEREYVHSYFFAKLRKLDFNLFDHAIENQPMTISFTSGDCGACNFEIGVTEEFPQKNPVQVNPDGTLKRDEKGRVICGQFEDITEDECQPQQQDTINNEVWIALKKEDTTYGILMPKAEIYEKDENGNIVYDENDKAVVKEAGHRPKAAINEDGTPNNEGDTFVILGSNLPLSYITNAEKKLEKELLKQLKDNNDEKFTFSIDFSRIYFEENDVLEQLSENSKIAIMYNDQRYDLYVSSFSYTMSEGDVLPEIRVELDDTLKVSQNAIQSAISQVKSELGRAIGSIDVVGAVNPYFIRKDADDEARGKINFTKGIKFGEGGKVEVLDNNSAKLTIEYLEVTKKASFTSLEIQEKTHVGGQLLVTPAAINCGEVEELDDAYRCYFQTKGTDGDEIFNQFAVGDQAICQTFNAWGSKYYWRLVTGIGEDYIDLSKTECDEGSGIPSAGDKIIQLGNQQTEERQNAIVIAAYGDGSPYIIQYKGIDAFEIPDSKIVTKLSSTENIFTGKVHMELGSDGAENLGLEFGGQNMLRNSGFTGDYLSAQLADEVVLESTSQTFNPPLIHWDSADFPAENAVVEDSEESQSGKAVVLNNGTITQQLYQKVIAGETYVLSFKAKGEYIAYRLGDDENDIMLTEEWTWYSQKIIPSSSSDMFTIFDSSCSICEIQLERGTIATAWGRSFLDNSSDRAYWQSRVYLDQALKANTEILGGLVLTQSVRVGQYNAQGERVKETGGMNGVYNEDDDVAFWAGGTIEQAINAIGQKGNNEANYVVSHGGKLIANDAIIRGTVYAQNGEFSGKVNATEGNFGEGCTIGQTIRVTNDGFTLDDNIQGYVSITGARGFSAKNRAGVNTTIGGILGQGAEIASEEGLKLGIGQSYVSPFGMTFTMGENEEAIRFHSGIVTGLRTSTRVVTNKGTVYDPELASTYDHNLLYAATNGDYYLKLPAMVFNGQELWLETMGANINVASPIPMWSHTSGTYETSHKFAFRGVIRFKYYGGDIKDGKGVWTYALVESH